MTISRSQARRLIPYLVELPHEKQGLAGLPNMAFRAANVPEQRFFDDPLDCGTGFCVVGGEKRWAQIVCREDFVKFAEHAKEVER